MYTTGRINYGPPVTVIAPPPPAQHSALYVGFRGRASAISSMNGGRMRLLRNVSLCTVAPPADSREHNAASKLLSDTRVVYIL